MASYEEALKAVKVTGASNASDAQVMALFCEGLLQTLCGAVAPSLVWQGAQAKGLTTAELAALAYSNPAAVEELMWV